MKSWWFLLFGALVWTVSALTPDCKLRSGDCVCVDPIIHSYCSNSTCAPDDSYCTSNDLPEDWVVLLDSHGYQNLIEGPSPVWEARDVDGDGVQWFQQGGSCENRLTTCSFGPQDNWIFSQHIKYPLGSVSIGETEIYLKIIYRFVQHLDHTSVYSYDTNSLASMRDRTNPSNYKPVFGHGTETTTSRLRQIGNTTLLRSFRTTGKMGFYFGIRDTGTCGEIRRVLVYYTPCKKKQDGLVSYPELVRAPEGSPPNTAEACCAPSSHNTTSLTFRAYSASDGRCEHNVTCECNAGYRLNTAGTGCTAVKFMLRGKTYNDDDDIVLITDIGEGENALMCMTDKIDCCKSPNEGQFYYPNSTTVGFSDTNSLYKDSDTQVVRLSRRNNILSPLGRYRCDIPDSNGVTQSIYINIALAMDPPTSPTSPTCPTPAPCPTPSPCPTSAPCPAVTCPPPQPTCYITQLKFMLHGIIYLNNTIVVMSDIGEESSALLCMTNKTDCCRPPYEGEFYYPNGTKVGFSRKKSLYRNRGPQLVRLNRRDGTLYPTGRYRCDIPDSSGVKQSIFINIVAVESSATQCPTLTSPADGRVSVSSSGIATYSCLHGYSIVGSLTRMCLSDGRWSEGAPTCHRGVGFELQGRFYTNGSSIVMTDIGEDDDAIIIRTEFIHCCQRQEVGICYSPNGQGINYGREELYSDRGPQLIRLNRRVLFTHFATPGLYCCTVPNREGIFQRICVNIVL